MTLLFGLILILPVFAAFLWSAARSLQTSGATRLGHAATVLSVLAAMAVISRGLADWSHVAGVMLGVSAAVVFWTEGGWVRLLPAGLFLFALILAFRLPFIADGPA